MRIQQCLFVIGTCHTFQCGLKPVTQEQIGSFQKYVYELCVSEEIRQIAEEMTEDGLSEKGITKTIFADVAKQLSVPNPYIDIDRKQRRDLGIDDYSLGEVAAQEGGGWADQKLIDKLTCTLSHPVRERIWCAKLLSLGVWPSLLICGADHVEAINDLCKSLELNVEIANADYKF